MVTVVEEIQGVKEMDERRGLVVELVGLAGAGKSTLFRKLGERGVPNLLCASTPPVWSAASAPFFLGNLLALSPVLLHSRLRRDRSLTRRELAGLAILHGWHQILRRTADREGKIVLVDQGAIHLMHALFLRGPKSFHDLDHLPWWQETLRKWSRSIDIVIWLDAPVETLRERIRGRPQNHELKEASEWDTYDWLTEDRWAYQQVVSNITAMGKNIRVMNIDTSQYSTEEIVRQLLPELTLNKCESGR